MINAQEQFFNNITNQLIKYFPNHEEIQLIQNIISSELNKYRLLEDDEKNEIVEYSGQNDYLLNMFLSTKKVEGKRESTLKRYQSMLRNMLNFLGNKPIKEITTNDIRYFLSSYQGIPGKQNSNTTVDGMRRICSSFFNWLEIEDYIEKSPARKLSQIKHDTVPEPPYTSGEIESMMLHADSVRDKTIIQFLYSTGCRVSELCKVKISDIDTIKKTVLLHGKGGKDRIVPLDDKIMFYLAKYIEFRSSKGIYNEYLFVSKSRPYLQISTSAVRYIVLKCGVKSGINHPHPHRFRVTRITVLLKRGMKLEDVQVIAGHSSITTTSGYNRIDYSLVYADFLRKG